VLEMLTLFYAKMGNPPDLQGAVAAMATDLAARGSIEAIQIALEACMTERYPVRLPHILAKLPGTEAADMNADKRRAWDVVEEFSSKWLRWNEDRTSAYIETGAPPISKRVIDCVRRSGGWSLYLRMTDEDYPFAQKRFFEEWEAWTDVDRISRDPSRALVFPALKQLAETRTMDRLERGRDHDWPAASQRMQDADSQKTPAAPTSPQKQRIMKAIANAAKPMR
jgi:hypothetical protein